MNRLEVYKQLEADALSYAELRNVPVVPNGEPLVHITMSKHLVGRQINANMLQFTGTEIYVRQDVARRPSKETSNIHRMFSTHDT